MTAPLSDLLTSWQVSLAAEAKAQKTRKAYAEGVRLFLQFCASADLPEELTKSAVTAFLAHLIEKGDAPATVRLRLVTLQRFAHWLAAEKEIPENPLVGMTPPKLDQKLIEPLTDAELRDMLKMCRGSSFRDIRDHALLRLMAETGMRAGECVALKVSDIDVSKGIAVVYKGKGGKARLVAFGPETATVLDKYLRTRRTHKLANRPELWLGATSSGFSYSSLYRTLCSRAESAGIPDFHPHLLRHTAASRWLRNGGSEGGLMQIAGWNSRQMVDRYAGATASNRAIEEAKRLGLGAF